MTTNSNGAIIDDFINGVDGDSGGSPSASAAKDVEDPNDDCAIGWWLTNISIRRTAHTPPPGRM